jgi:hypothetical protein
MIDVTELKTIDEAKAYRDSKEYNIRECNGMFDVWCKGRYIGSAVTEESAIHTYNKYVQEKKIKAPLY